MIDVVKDISDLTGVYKYQLDKLVDKTEEEICQCVLESIQNKDEVCSLDLGYGNLIIDVDEDGIVYKFIPSESLEKMLVSTVQSGKSPLQVDIECNIQKRMLKLYKELF